VSPSTAGRLAGALFLAAFVLYGGGSALADRPLGLGLMLLNSLAVAVIGALAFGALRGTAPWTARAYLAARVAEGLLLALGVLLLASGRAEANGVAYAVAMVALGAGSVPFCRALAAHRWAPGWMAWWGVGGYALLAAGAVLEFAVPGAGVLLAVPGGIFELALGVLLIGRGFRAPADRVESGGPVSTR
jgi:hypothetical protein